MWRSQALVVLLAAGALGGETFLCPEDETTGKFADPDWCDRYWDCFKGEATPIDCADGTVFDPNLISQANPCDYIYKVNCTGRDTIDEPRGTGVCTRRNGVYAHEDPNVCDKYYTCRQDSATLHLCAPGLHFNPESKLCDWPTMAKRGACTARDSLNGFTCDGKDYFTAAGQKISHPNYPHPEDCTKFYVCQGGTRPSISGCDEGLVFNAETRMCDFPENVPECNFDYEDYPEEVGAETTNA